MPKQQCKDNGKTGVKWGNKGKCYTGKNKETKMNQQRKAIEASKYRKEIY